ncbi:MAG: DUF3098 domain-containing protein [Bacteroidetes bacterium]|nr:DUF3098 domain-containing protein [Bacteroidota bacterium]
MKPTFERKNYIILLAGIFLIVLGYILMIGGKSEDPNVFNPAIFNFQRITLAPVLCLIGFVTIIFAIMWRPKTNEEVVENGKLN